MSQPSRFHILDKASIRPNKIVFYTQFFPKNKFLNSSDDGTSSTSIAQKSSVSSSTKNQPICNKHNFELSKKATGRIKEKVSWLYELAKIKTVIPEAGKPMYSFKINFITLTLPAVQVHATAEINSICLHQFFTECKKKFNLSNYVWRLEFQKNGNAHYHIATDTYVSYTDCKLIWNRCLQKLNYISSYSSKMSKLSFEDYRMAYSDNNKIPFNILRERYYRGVATRWDSPNTVDVRAVSSAKNIAFYISKYITKKSDEKLNPIVSAREPSNTNLRLWFCSKSLSALDKISIFMDSYSDLVHEVLSSIQQAKRFIFDYCTVWYFNAVDQMGKTKRLLWQLYREYALERGYVPSTS